MKQNKQTYYAVARGYKTGVFTDWHGPNGAQAQTKGFRPNPIFRKFNSREEAEVFLIQHDHTVQDTLKAEHEKAIQERSEYIRFGDHPQEKTQTREIIPDYEKTPPQSSSVPPPQSSSVPPRETRHVSSHGKLAEQTRDANWQTHAKDPELQPHWGENFLKQRMRSLKNLRITLPRPPATEPVDRQDITASIITDEWCAAHNIPIPSEIVDGEYQLAQEVYRRVLYAETWTEKDLHMQTFFAIVDDKRDFNLKQTSDVTFQCLDRHAKSVRRIAHDSAQIKTSQQAEIKLTSNYKDLEKLNIKLSKQIEEERKKCNKLQHQLATAKAEVVKRSAGVRSSDAKTKRSPPKEIPTPASSSGYKSPEECEIELSNLALQEISDGSDIGRPSSPEASITSVGSEVQEFLNDEHADLQYESEQERLATLFNQEKPKKTLQKKKKKITFDLSNTDNYSACEFCIPGFGKRTGHRGAHLKKRPPSSSK
jgi:hypothetical protein